MAAYIPAGLGYLALGMAAAAANIALVINRDRVAQWYSDSFIQQLDEAIAASDRAPRRTRWLYWQYRNPRLRDVETRPRIAAFAGRVWMGGAFMLTIVTVILIGSAVAEFIR